LYRVGGASDLSNAINERLPLQNEGSLATHLSYGLRLTFSIPDLQQHVTNAQLDDACRKVAGASCWIITDGKAGDISNCVGVTARLNLQPEMKKINPRKLFALMMPHGPIDPAESPSKPGSPIAPPFPDIAIASGRRAAAYLRAVKKASKGKSFTVFLKGGNLKPSFADLIWVPQHDKLRAKNVLTTLTSPHDITEKRLKEARENPPFDTDKNKRLVGVILGGKSRHHHFSEADITNLIAKLERIAGDNTMLLVSPSRRTPPELALAAKTLCAQTGGFYWDGQTPNPYLAILGLADHLIVTADSVNMVGEAVSTGKPVHLFTPSGGHTKILSFVKGLIDHEAVRELGEHLENWRYKSIDATPIIAVVLAERFDLHRASKKTQSA
jgi:uncharacterized protein